MTKEQVIKAIKRLIGGVRQKDWCEAYNVNQTVLSDVLRGHRAPTKQLCNMVGVERVTVIQYRSK
jgi:hypothetical protein